jgi:hypothetical protein
MNILIVISSKSPNNTLYNCIDSLYKIQIKDDEHYYKICVVDSDSDDFTNYNKIKIDFPEVDIHFTQNKNYEYGAWKYAHEIYQNYYIYICIQDTIIIEKKINMSIINDNTVYTCHHYSGYYSHECIKEKGIDNLKDSGLYYEPFIDTHFNLAYGNIFIVNNDVIKDIFITLKNPPIDKDGSCFYERNFGLYFIIKNINTIDLSNYIIKEHGGRI